MLLLMVMATAFICKIKLAVYCLFLYKKGVRINFGHGYEKNEIEFIALSCDR
jgi:hypothetical protein